MNVTQISGGTRSNVIPDEARAVDPTCGCRRWRMPRGSMRRCDPRRRWMRDRARGGSAASIGRRWNAARTSLASYDQARAIARELGLS